MSKESKFLSRVLRGMKRAGHRLSLDALRQVVTDNDKQRFTLSEDGRRIRAAQGHSVAVDLGLMPIEPPATLFHGTARDNLDAIFASGLNPGRRQHVHLSPDEGTAVKVGTRHGRPVVLRVNTAAMHANGLPFWRADNNVWLTATVPPEYLGF